MYQSIYAWTNFIPNFFFPISKDPCENVITVYINIYYNIGCNLHLRRKKMKYACMIASRYIHTIYLSLSVHVFSIRKLSIRLVDQKLINHACMYCRLKKLDLTRKILTTSIYVGYIILSYINACFCCFEWCLFNKILVKKKRQC